MLLRGVDWGHVFNSSGARGFAGEGYWFHGFLESFGLRYDGATFVSKTTTLSPRAGNMRLDDDGRPLARMPDCIVVRPMKGAVLNAVGLSGPGAAHVLRKIRWRKDIARFVVSFMPVASTVNGRIAETREFVREFQVVLGTKGSDNVALQVNFSCPNVGLDTSHIVDEVAQVLDQTAGLGVATLIKISAVVPPEVACELASHGACDAVVCSNTIPWGQLPTIIDWERLFGSKTSPLARYGGGGLSGRPLLPIVERWIRMARKHGMPKPIVGGGGILGANDADRLITAGAEAVELGSVSILRPWRVASIIEHVNKRLGAEKADAA